MKIGIIPDPEGHRDWPVIRALLEPAAKRGGVPILERNEAVWAVYADGPIAAATARLTTDGHGEVILVGGANFREWIGQLDWLIGSWMRREGMRSVRAYGRKGWRKILKDWTVIGNEGGMTAYERAL